MYLSLHDWCAKPANHTLVANIVTNQQMSSI